ncbi:MAG: hypothetical protein WKF82_06520 [Nocardioidaceae bacterium]
MDTQLAGSKGAARRTADGGVYVNNERITDAEQRLASSDVLAGGWSGASQGQEEPRRSAPGLRLSRSQRFVETTPTSVTGAV